MRPEEASTALVLAFDVPSASAMVDRFPRVPELAAIDPQSTGAQRMTPGFSRSAAATPTKLASVEAAVVGET